MLSGTDGRGGVLVFGKEVILKIGRGGEKNNSAFGKKLVLGVSCATKASVPSVCQIIRCFPIWLLCVPSALDIQKSKILS